MGSDEDGKRKRMVRNGGRERRVGRSWPVPLPELLVGLPGASHLALFFHDGGLQFPRDSEGGSKES
jgi:hypothetical protein